MSNPTLPNLLDEFRKDIPNRMFRANLPGLALAIVGGDSILWESGFGTTDRRETKPVTSKTIFSMQSCSKTFTATAVLLAVQDGLLNLDAPIHTYLPGFTLQSRFDPHPEERITLRLLLSHKAGFTHEAPIGNNFVYDTASVTFSAHINSIRKTWLRFPVGQRYSYSNLGIDLAGYILQEVSGLPFQEYMRIKLFEPLGMTRTSFDFQRIEADADRAIGHDVEYETMGLPVPLIVPMMPSGGIYSSASDIARYIQFQLNRGKIGSQVILDPNYLDEVTAVPQPVTGQVEGYALGLAVTRNHEMRQYNHSGGGFGFLSNMLWFPEWGLGIVILTNSSNHNLQWWYANHIIDKMLEIPSYKDRQKLLTSTGSTSKPIPTSTISTTNQIRLVGNYIGRLPNQCMVKLIKDTITICFRGEKKPKPLYFYNEEEAYTVNPDANTDTDKYQRYHFIVDEMGVPLRMIHLQDGNVYDYNATEKPASVRKSQWRMYPGYYSVSGGRYPIIIRIQLRKGNLFANYYGAKLILEEHQPGLFFTSTGEAIDFRENPPVFAGIVVQKIGISTIFHTGMVLLKLIVRNGWLLASAGLRLRLKKRKSKG